MQALKILIVEDDLLLAEQLSEQLVEFGYTITDNVSNSKDALIAFRKRLPDLVVMDIHLEGSKLDGIELAQEFNTIEKVPIIFLTGIGGMETVERSKIANPVYYLIKPCNSLQLQIALDIGLYNFTNHQKAEVEHSLQFHTPPPHCLYFSKDFFFVKIDSRFFRIGIPEIIYVKAESPGNYIRIVTDKNNILQSLGLKSFTEQVQHNSLMRVNRSYVVNINKVVAFDGGRAFVNIDGQQKEVPIGVTYRDEFQKRFLKLKSD